MDANHITGPYTEEVIPAVLLKLSAAQWKGVRHHEFREKPAFLEPIA